LTIKLTINQTKLTPNFPNTLPTTSLKMRTATISR